MVVGIKQAAGCEALWGIIVRFVGQAQNSVDQASSSIERNSGTGAGHATKNVLALAIEGTDNWVFIRRETDRAGPLIGDSIIRGAEVIMHRSTDILGQKS